MVFGAFDIVHPGHRAMFKEAKKYGNYLIAVVAPDSIVAKLKGHPPQSNLAKRMAELRREKLVDEVVAGDKKAGSWTVVKKHWPEVIACGYDQTKLKKNLVKNINKLGYQPKIVSLGAFKPDKYKSSLLTLRRGDKK